MKAVLILVNDEGLVHVQQVEGLRQASVDTLNDTLRQVADDDDTNIKSTLLEE